MAHEVVGDLVQPVVAGDQVVLLAERLLELLLLLLVQRRLVEQRVQLVLQLVGGELQLGLPRLVVERHRRAVRDGLGEVVDRDVVAEDLARPLLLPGDQRRAGEADEGGVGQRPAHVGGELVVLAAVRLVGDDDDVARAPTGPASARGRAVENLWISVKT